VKNACIDSFMIVKQFDHKNNQVKWFTGPSMNAVASAPVVLHSLSYSATKRAATDVPSSNKVVTKKANIGNHRSTGKVEQSKTNDYCAALLSGESLTVPFLFYWK